MVKRYKRIHLHSQNVPQNTEEWQSGRHMVMPVANAAVLPHRGAYGENLELQGSGGWVLNVVLYFLLTY